MRKIILGTVVCLGAAIGSAQMMETVHMTLPVAAKVGKVTLPAGTYSIREISNSVIQISPEAGKGPSTLATVMQIVAPNQETPDHTKVVLRQAQSGLQVDKIWFQGQDLGVELNTAAE